MNELSRRSFLVRVSAGCVGLGLSHGLSLGAKGSISTQNQPNIILCMSDDQGWGDTGYNGHKLLKTPVLDEMAKTGLRFDRFYAQPVCSPARGSVMTGRHPVRFGCFKYNYSIRPQEITVADAVKTAGYATGHFGKWHLGPVKASSCVNPGACGFDEWLSHDNFFENSPSLSQNGQEPKTVQGEGSEVVVDAALEFIRKSVRSAKPFLAVVWFGSPHSPHKALPRDTALYDGHKRRHYLGEITAMDRAIGKLRTNLKELKISDNTLFWFCSDNGATAAGSTGGLKGKKGSTAEGGVRVPCIIEWPGRIKNPIRTKMPCSTMDIYPTVVDLLGLKIKNQVLPIDGVSLKELFDGKMEKRPKPIPFGNYNDKTSTGSFIDPTHLKGWWRTFKNRKYAYREGQKINAGVLIDNQYKLVGEKLYDIDADPTESKDISQQHPAVVKRMKTEIDQWSLSAYKSLCGMDYKDGPTK
jgi:arylsulfatase A-like enzyme